MPEAPGKPSPAKDREVTDPDDAYEERAVSAPKVLIMDDEPAIVEIASEGLCAMGYEVETASKGEEAIELYKKALETGHPFDVVILDLTIAGGMGGIETAKELLDIDPDAVLIVSTGYSDKIVMQHPEELGFSFSLPKPYRLSQLKEAIDSLTRHRWTYSQKGYKRH
jgi:CheY-like chemotaxis protein